jgi:hypothetical protein
VPVAPDREQRLVRRASDAGGHVHVVVVAMIEPAGSAEVFDNSGPGR